MDAEDARSFDFDERWVTWSRWLFAIGLASAFLLLYSQRYIAGVAVAVLGLMFYRAGGYLRVIELLQDEVN